MAVDVDGEKEEVHPREGAGWTTKTQPLACDNSDPKATPGYPGTSSPAVDNSPLTYLTGDPITYTALRLASHEPWEPCSPHSNPIPQASYPPQTITTPR